MRKIDIVRNAIISSQKPMSTYIELEYIESTGQQWIDTGLLNTGDYIFKDRVLVNDTKPDGNDGQWIIGGRLNPNYSLGVFLLSSTSTAATPIAGYGGVTANASPTITVAGSWLEIDFSRNDLYITLDGTKRRHNFVGKGLVPEEYKTNILLGKNQINWAGTGEDNRNLFGYRSGTTITDAITGEVLRDFVAAKNESGEIGMYEKVSKQFYTSAGPLPFIAGPEK